MVLYLPSFFSRCARANSAPHRRAAVATIARYHGRLGRGLASVVNLLDPDVIVLGGGMSNLPGLETAAADAMRPYVFSDVVDTVIRRNVHGDSSGVRGAAWLWSEQETAPAH